MSTPFQFTLPIIAFIILPLFTQAQVTGLWKTYGEKDGKEKAIIEIYEQQGKLHGKILKLLPDALITQCHRCPGELKDKPITGMVILKDLTKTSSGGKDGTIMDPSSGKTYHAFIELEGNEKLKLRGYIGAPAFGKTQYWSRVR